MSTSLNTLSGTIFKDFIAPHMEKRAVEERASMIMKMIVIVMGVICTLLVLVIENLGHILEIASSFGGLTTGTSLGIFTLGILFPQGNTWGALSGGLVSILLMAWIFIGNQIATYQGLINYPGKPVRIDGCSNSTTVHSVYSEITPNHEQVFFLYKLSVFHYGLISCLVVLLIGVPVSLITGRHHQLPHRDLLCPLIYRWLPPPPTQSTDRSASEYSLKSIEDSEKREDLEL